MSNFRRLINRLKTEINNQGHETAINKSLPYPAKKRPGFKAVMNSLCKSAKDIDHKINAVKFQPLSKSQKIMINRMNMRNFRTSIRESYLNKAISGDEVCRLEARANAVSSALASRGFSLTVGVG